MASKPKLDQTERVGKTASESSVPHSASLSRTDVLLRLSNSTKIRKKTRANWILCDNKNE